VIDRQVFDSARSTCLADMRPVQTPDISIELTGSGRALDSQSSASARNARFLRLVEASIPKLVA
jgi:hypothetical protein